MRIFPFLLSIAVLSGLFTGCGINNNMLFKTPVDSDFSLDTLLNVPIEKSVIVPNDELDFKLVTNNGDGLLQAFTSFSGVGSTGVVNASFSYRVKENGFVLLPLLGEVKVQDLTVEQCEDSLRVWYSKHFRDPFVQLRVTTRRVVFFSGSGVDLRAIPLVNSETRLIDVLAAVNGIPERGKASKVKLLRKYGDEWKVFMIDLSTIENLKFVDIIVRENDYIYVEPRPYILREVIKESGPVVSIVSIFSTTLFFIAAITGN
jgi:polysaccharide export outer membrane protein